MLKAFTARRAVFLDRDGTLNNDAGYTHRIEELVLIENALAGLLILRDLGFKLIVVSNQSGIARGYFTPEQMHTFNRHLAQLLSDSGIHIDAFYHCPHLRDAAVEAYRRDCPHRKPLPGMLLQAAREHNIDLARSYAIGDKHSDVRAGLAAGCRAILVLTGVAAAGDPRASSPHYIARDLLDAAHFIAREEAVDAA